MRFILGFLFIVLSNSISLAQQHIFQKVNIALPSPECYRILQDKQGHVWVATEQGLCKYDGQKTVVFNAKNGLSEKGVYALKMDEKGVIWALTKNGRLIQLKNDTVFPFGVDQLNDDVKSEIGYDLFFQQDKLIIPFGYSTVMALDLTSKKRTKYRSNLPDGHSLVITNNNQTIPYRISPLPKSNVSNYFIRYENKQHPEFNQLVEVQLNTSVSTQIISCTFKNRAFFSVSNQLIEIDANGKKHQYTFPHRILSLLPDALGGMWVGVLGNGVHYFEDADFSKPAIRGLPGLSVSNIMEDREGHVWCTTLEKGVYICQQPEIIAYNNFQGLNRRMDYLGAHEGHFITSTNYNKLIFINNNHQVTSVNLIGNFGEVVTAVECIDKEWFIGQREMISSGVKIGNKIQLKRRKDVPSAGIEFQKRSGILYSLSYINIISKFNNEKFISIFHGAPKINHCFLPLSDQKFLIVQSKDVVLLELNQGKNKTKIIRDAPKFIVKLFHAKKSNRYFAITKGAGIYEWKNGGFIDRNKQMQLSIDVLNDIIEDQKGNVWIATNEGLLFYALDGQLFKKPKLFNENHGFPSEVCTKLAINDKYLAVSTTEGLITFPLNCKLESMIDPQILLQSVFIHGKQSVIHNSKLQHDQNSIELDFRVLSYHHPFGQSIYYTLERKGKFEQGTSNPLLHLQNLAPGSYLLKVFGRNIYGINSKIPVEIEFEILPPFWATWWFVLCSILLGLIILLFLFLWIKRRIELRAEQENRVKVQLARSQLTALQAQMNPHFLFNSISSIQNFIMSNKREEAYNYLTSFSKLIRTTLNNSRSQFISLEKELETIELYMQLEQKRFNNTFDFRIELDNDIQPKNIFLPASMIQPLLENALWHGIMTIRSERRGVIILHISKDNDFLQISVTDNGKGLQNSDPSHQSLALKMIEEQLKLLAENSNKKRNTHVELTPNDTGEGITASFCIPLIINL